MSRRKISIGYCDMWSGFDPDRYGLTQNLRRGFDVVLSDEPEYLFFSVFGDAHLERQAYRKVFVTHEAAYPDFRHCDFALSFYWPMRSKRHLYYPNFLHYLSWEGLDALATSHEEGISLRGAHRDFCAFLVSNGRAKPRNELFERLSAYRPVASGGKYANNMDRVVTPAETIDFLGQHKFVISGENSVSPGYVTEKILQALKARSVPVYWGDDYVKRIFNPARFLFARDFSSLDALVEEVARLDQADDQYMAMLSQPVFVEGHLPRALGEAHVMQFFSALFRGDLDREPRPRIDELARARRVGLHRRNVMAPVSQDEDALTRELRLERQAAALMD